jgi:hypothetical protein
MLICLCEIVHYSYVLRCDFVSCAARCGMIQCSAVRCSAVQCSAVQCGTVQSSTVQSSALQCKTMHCSEVQCSTVQSPYRWATSPTIHLLTVFWRCTVMSAPYTVKKGDFTVPSWDITNQTLPGREKFNYSRPGWVWVVTSRLVTGKSIIFFTVYNLTFLPLYNAPSSPLGTP